MSVRRIRAIIARLTMTRAGRLLLLALLLRWTAMAILWPMRQDTIGATFLHTISIPFHEAGHVLFSPLGDLLTSLGGSAMQVIVPIVCLVAFLTTSVNPFAAAVTLWWAGENLADVAVYVNDARALQLVLIGGYTGQEVEGHDWEHILQTTGLLHRDHQIAWTLHWTGAAAMIAGLAWAAVVTLRKDAS